MIGTAPVGYERLPLPVNPIQNRKTQLVSARPAPRQVEPLVPVQAVTDRPGRKARDPLERLYLLTVGTRRSLLQLDLEHPLNGPHPTD